MPICEVKFIESKHALQIVMLITAYTGINALAVANEWKNEFMTACDDGSESAEHDSNDGDMVKFFIVRPATTNHWISFPISRKLLLLMVDKITVGLAD